MFHLRYDHQTKKELQNVDLRSKSTGGRQRFCKQNCVPTPIKLDAYFKKYVQVKYDCVLMRLAHLKCMLLTSSSGSLNLAFTGSNQAYRAISTSQLNVLPRLHLWPIDEVVYLGSQGYLVLRGASRLDAFSGYPVRS